MFSNMQPMPLISLLYVVNLGTWCLSFPKIKSHSLLMELFKSCLLNIICIYFVKQIILIFVKTIFREDRILIVEISAIPKKS